MIPSRYSHLGINYILDDQLCLGIVLFSSYELMRFFFQMVDMSCEQVHIVATFLAGLARSLSGEMVVAVLACGYDVGE